MITMDMRRNGQDPESARVGERAVLEQRAGLQSLLRSGIAQARAAVMGAQPPIRSMVATVHVEFSRHVAQADALMAANPQAPPFVPSRNGRLQGEFTEELATLEALGAWSEENDELELALRFQELAPVLLEVMAAEERYLLETLHR
jgi:hypothetical protein